MNQFTNLPIAQFTNKLIHRLANSPIKENILKYQAQISLPVISKLTFP